MIDVEKFTKWLKTEDGKKSLEKTAANMRRTAEKERQSVNTDTYIKWLECFTKEHPSFNDDDWLYCPDEITDEERAYVSELGYFFNGIRRYAADNYIYPESKSTYGQCYCVKYNERVYEIGQFYGQGITFFCEVCDEPKASYIIQFEDIANPSEEALSRTKRIKKQLERLDLLFNELFENGVPCDAIIERADKVASDIRKRED